MSAPDRARSRAGALALAALLALAAALSGAYAWRARSAAAPAPADAAPKVSAFLRRGRALTRWSPPEPFAPGDLLRFKVAPAGRRYLTVWTEAGAGAPAVLYSGPVDPDREQPLQVVLRPGEPGGPDRVVFAFGQTRPPGARAQAAARGLEEWLLVLPLPRAALAAPERRD